MPCGIAGGYCGAETVHDTGDTWRILSKPGSDFQVVACGYGSYDGATE
jgi:hypothetical protein